MNNLMARSGLLDDFFKDVAPGFYVKPLHGDPLPAQIKVDVKETPAAYTVLAELPGVPKEDIHVTVEGNVVTLRAEVKQGDRQAEGEKVLRSERYYGAVSRSFQMPVDSTTVRPKPSSTTVCCSSRCPRKWRSPGQRLNIE